MPKTQQEMFDMVFILGDVSKIVVGVPSVRRTYSNPHALKICRFRGTGTIERVKKVRTKIVLTLENEVQVLEAAVGNSHISVRELVGTLIC